VEFAVEAASGATRVVVLQARPVTSGPLPEGGDDTTIWTRANLGEALPGPATPLTWSVASRFAERGFRAAFEALGCRVPKSARLVANVEGRFYLNLSAFVRIAAQVPFVSPRRLVALAGGVPDRFVPDLERCAAEVSPRRFLMRAPFVLPRLAREQLLLGPRLSAWESDARRRYVRLRELDLELLPDDALVETLRGVARFLDEVGTKMLEAASASMVSHLALARTLATILRRFDDKPIARSLDERAAGLAHTLTAGMRALESAEPGLALARIADLAREEPAALDALRAGDATSIEALPDGPTRRALASTASITCAAAARAVVNLAAVSTWRPGRGASSRWWVHSRAPEAPGTRPRWT
jgi:pyruvate,water dikinase